LPYGHVSENLGEELDCPSRNDEGFPGLIGYDELDGTVGMRSEVVLDVRQRLHCGVDIGLVRLDGRER
jgi:hypothetical protein